MTFDRTKISTDPLDPQALSAVLEYLNSHRRRLNNNDYNKYLASATKNSTTLDIGVVEHTVARMSAPDWKHKIIHESATRTVGVDIIPELIDDLNSKGYDVRLCDATSDEDLGERFSIVHIGDVIEHVDSPVALMKFAKRHLEPGGKIIIRTSNLEHVFYITPTHMLEIARRSGLELSGYLTRYPGGFSYKGIRRVAAHILKGFRLRHAFAELFANAEQYSTIYVYELTH
jgi:2-polyprenyl-3-methyl-5-hydroxy-6-metoxy-1,4-benzoquinol methylase